MASWLKRRCAVTTMSPGPDTKPGEAEKFAKITLAFLIDCRHYASSHVTTIALFRRDSERNLMVSGWHVQISTHAF